MSRDQRLDIVHAHYAVPHATAAYLADQILAADGVPAPPRMVTTLHGTDITLVGSDPSYARVVAFSIEQSHGVTAVSNSLRPDTIAALGYHARHSRHSELPGLRRSTAGGRCRSCAIGCTPAASSTSSCTCRTSARSSASAPCSRSSGAFARGCRARLVMIGDGPDRRPLEQRVAEAGLQDVVEFAGEQHDLVPWLSAADLFLLPSEQESFGLAALEAMACEVPVVASRVGGLPEIIDDGLTGFLCAPDDLEGMAARGVAVLSDPDLQERIGRAAAEDVRTRFCTDLIVSQYEQCYRDVLESR